MKFQEKVKITAIVLAAGSGRRMGGDCKKQYLLLDGRPILYYALQTFEESNVDEIILVTGEKEYCRREIIEKYHMKKVKKIIPGGMERYNSVYNGLLEAEDSAYVLIHDGARPLVTADIVERSIAAVKECQACVVGMPVKDTIKIADVDGYSAQTPDRNSLWMVQTPQSFSYPLILSAYQKVLADRPGGITDDAMVVEYTDSVRVKLIPGSYENIKITTPEDLDIAHILLAKKYSNKMQESY